MPDTDLFLMTATELSKLLRRKKMSSLELTRMFLERLEQLGPKYNALAELTPELALAQAKRADRALRKGETTSPLLGVPYGAKDLLATKNIPTRWGAPSYRDQVFDYDATVITKLREAGAVLVGKLAMVELAGGGGYHFASASLHGPGLNPWNVNYWSGGSSSGSGTAIAAGLVPYALGSETWGSIMTPAAFCGVTGLRPTWGLVSRHGAMELAWSMDKVGPMARSAEDCGWVLQAIACHDAHDFTTSERAFKFKPRASRSDFRIGVLPVDFSTAPECEQVFEEALRVLRKAGMKLKRVELPAGHEYETITRTLLNGEASAAHEELIASERLNELVDTAQKEGLRRSVSGSVTAYARAQQRREPAKRAVLSLFDSFDVLVAPTVAGEAPTLDTDLSLGSGGRRGYGVLGALAGVPSLSVPMGFGARGLPLGLSITGNLFDENTLLQVGMIYQRETAWHRMRPSVAT